MVMQNYSGIVGDFLQFGSRLFVMEEKKTMINIDVWNKGKGV